VSIFSSPAMCLKNDDDGWEYLIFKILSGVNVSIEIFWIVTQFGLAVAIPTIRLHGVTKQKTTIDRSF
jgi:hypothetical protein